MTRFTLRGPVTLRGRLLAIVLACVLISCAAVAIATTVALRRFLLDRLDQQLSAAGSRYALTLEHPPIDQDIDDGSFAAVIGQPAGTLGARVKGGAVTAFAIVGEPGRTADPATRRVLASLRASGGARTVSLPSFGDYRLQVVAGRDGDLLITGLPEHPVDETIAHLLEIEAMVFAGALLVSAIGATIFVRLSLRPLNRVARTALQVSELPLASGAVSIPDRVDDPASPGTEVGQVAEAFNHMLSHVEDALAQRQSSEEKLRRFVADASHELRTPVSVVRAHAEYARRVDEGMNAETSHALDRISAEADRMSVLVDELLLLARLDAGRPLAREDVDVSRLAIDAVRDAQVAAPDHYWQLDLPDEPVVITGDEHALHQVMANLLSNARGHTPAGTMVTTAVEVTGGRVLVRVSDDGPGIPDALQARIFERFVHGTGSDRGGSGGSGLGLSIVAAIAAAHGGSVRLTSEPGRTEFTVELPTG